MITTIQLNEQVKNSLDRLKESKRQTYEEVISKLIKLSETHKRKQEKLIIEGYKKMAKESLKIAKEWEGTLMDGLDKDEKWQK